MLTTQVGYHGGDAVGPARETDQGVRATKITRHPSPPCRAAPFPLKGASVEIRVHAKHMDLSDDLRGLAEEKVAHAVRVFDGAVTFIDVEFTEEQNPRLTDARYRLEITSTVAGQVVRVEAAESDARTVIDTATDRFARRLRRHKKRLITLHRRGEKRLNDDPEPVEDEDTDDRALVIDRVKRFEVKPMTTEEAALQMEMLEHSFYLFLDADTDRYCVLYRRRGGTLGLIEPQ
jgi:putative sigma-54 modulation protein